MMHVNHGILQRTHVDFRTPCQPLPERALVQRYWEWGLEVQVMADSRSCAFADFWHNNWDECREQWGGTFWQSTTTACPPSTACTMLAFRWTKVETSLKMCVQIPVPTLQESNAWSFSPSGIDSTDNVNFTAGSNACWTGIPLEGVLDDPRCIAHKNWMSMNFVGTKGLGTG